MRKVVAAVIALSLTVLSACTTTENYEKRLDQYIGKSEKELVMTWGVPDKTYQLDASTKMLSYVNHQTVYYPGSIDTCVGMVGRNTVFNNCAGAGFPPTTETFHCETIFTIANGRVARWGHKGNNCRA
jgi:hypothetical protein